MIATLVAAVLFPTGAAPLGNLADIQADIQNIINEGASYWNVSMSAAFGVTGDDGEPTIIAAAAGIDSHATGIPTTIESMYPSGSADKAFTAVGCLRAVELGKLDLDKPVYTYIDPWNAKQGRPTLKEMWGGDATINTVTGRMLLGMRSGIPDYDDFGLFNWTLYNPDADYLPQMFVNNVNKSFLFQPNQGGMYSGVGYVMAGMMLSAVSGADTWDQLNQNEAATGSPNAPTLKHTVFMGTGKCTKYPKVVSQYFYNYQPYTATISDLDAAAAAATAASTSDQQRTKANKARVPWAKVATPPSSVANGKDLGGCAAGSSNYWANTVGVGVQISQDHAGAASDCCAKAKTVPNAYAWTYENAWGKAGGSCIYWSTLYTGKSSVGSATGLVDQPTKLSDFHDLADYSCLNGWTMGNIAVAPQDVVRFYLALADGKLVSPGSLAQMLDFVPLTMGTDPAAGTPYGLGLLSIGLNQPVQNSGADCSYPNFIPYNGKCYTNITGWGHPGLDWASGMPRVAYVPSLKMSYAFAFNSYMGMNSTLGTLENKGTHMYSEIACNIVNRILSYLKPDVYNNFVPCGGSR